ncbi:hypothetical protein X994_2773 [Burkholderia pseudomallei]|nr:hypothetical protein X994_2773 [Burkholderia pseudomallei]
MSGRIGFQSIRKHHDPLRTLQSNAGGPHGSERGLDRL